jgi:hypothetical protein
MMAWFLLRAARRRLQQQVRDRDSTPAARR